MLGSGVSLIFSLCFLSLVRSSAQDMTGPRTHPVDGGWTTWIALTACSTSCGAGYQHFTRSCTHPAPINGGKECVGKKEERRTCNLTLCTGNNRPQQLSPDQMRLAKKDSTPAHWSQWSPWSQCTWTCPDSNGHETRSRSCITAIGFSSGCNGINIEEKGCTGICAQIAHNTAQTRIVHSTAQTRIVHNTAQTRTDHSTAQTRTDHSTAQTRIVHSTAQTKIVHSTAKTNTSSIKPPLLDTSKQSHRIIIVVAVGSPAIVMVITLLICICVRKCCLKKKPTTFGKNRKRKSYYDTGRYLMDKRATYWIFNKKKKQIKNNSESEYEYNSCNDVEDLEESDEMSNNDEYEYEYEYDIPDPTAKTSKRMKDHRDESYHDDTLDIVARNVALSDIDNGSDDYEYEYEYDIPKSVSEPATATTSWHDDIRLYEPSVQKKQLLKNNPKTDNITKEPSNRNNKKPDGPKGGKLGKKDATYDYDDSQNNIYQKEDMEGENAKLDSDYDEPYEPYYGIAEYEGRSFIPGDNTSTPKKQSMPEEGITEDEGVMNQEQSNVDTSKEFQARAGSDQEDESYEYNYYDYEFDAPPPEVNPTQCKRRSSESDDVSHDTEDQRNPNKYFKQDTEDDYEYEYEYDGSYTFGKERENNSDGSS